MHRHQAAALLGVLTVTMSAAADSTVVTYPDPKGIGFVRGGG